MTHTAIDNILDKSILDIEGVSWERVGGGNWTVADYEGEILGKRVTLHLLTQEFHNWWLVVYPEGNIKIQNDELITVTKELKGRMLNCIEL